VLVLRPQVLQELKYLRHLVLKGNPIVSVPGYWETVVDLLPNLESLDGRKASSAVLRTHCSVYPRLELIYVYLAGL
jgi:hypothetical protein